jgi:hypothetical protein
MKKSAVLFLVTMCLLGLALAQEARPRVPVPADSRNLDIIFAIDASGSMAWTDPSEFRKAVVNCLIDITRDQGGGRIAVVQFAGWKETGKKGSTVLFKNIPEDAQLRRVVINGIKETISDEKELAPFGVATDFNFAFEKAIKEVLDLWGKSKNKIWLILVSDGSMEVVEGSHVREAYLTKLVSQGKRINRPNLNEAAKQMFINDVLPKISTNEWWSVDSIDDVHITCVNLGSQVSDILQEICKLTNAQLLRTSEKNLETVIIEAFSELPQGYPDHGISRGFEYLSSEVAPDSTLSHPFHIYEGASTTHLLVLGGNRQFTIDIKNQAGASIIGARRGKLVRGEGELYRLVSIANEPFGDYTLEVTNSNASSTTFEFLEYAEFGLAAHVGVAGLKGEFYPGETLRFEVGLKQAKTNAFVKDPSLISETVVLFQVKDVDGTVTKSTMSFPDLNEARTYAESKLPEDAPGGKYELTVRVAALKKTVSGNYAFLSDPISLAFSVLSPVVELHFAQKEIFIGQAVKVVGIVTTGSLTEQQKQEGLTTKVVNSVTHAEKDAELAWDETVKQLTGTITLDETKEWELQKAPLGTGQVKPAQAGQILVKPRAVRIFQVDKANKKVPVESLKLKGELEKPVTARLIVEADLAAGETGELTASFTEAMEEAKVTMTLSGKTETTTVLTAENPSAPLTLTLELRGYPERGEVGRIVITAKLPGVSVEKKVNVSTEIPHKPFPWLSVLIAAGAILLLVIILLVIFSGPTFDRQQLYLVGGAGHHLKEWKTGRKNALGTAEVPRTLIFRLKGSKGRPRCVVMPGKNTKVFVNNVECSYWAEVHHGDYLEVFPAGDEFSYRYRYFEKTPTAGELQAAVEVAEEIGEGVFLGEDEFILAEDEDLGAAPGDATQALLEQARRLKEMEGLEATEILVEKPERTAEAVLDEVFREKPAVPQEELVREAAEIPGDKDFTEAVPTMPGDATEAIVSEFYEEGETEPTQVIGAEEGSFFEEIAAEDVGEGLPDLPISAETEPTQAIGEKGFAEEVVGEATEAIMPGEDFAGAVLTEPTEEIGEVAAVDELTELVEERLEISEFVEYEGEEVEPDTIEDEAGISLAEELDRTFDEILGEEEEKDKEGI